MEQFQSDESLLALFRTPGTKEAAFTAIVNKYKERLYWHIRRMVIIHEDADDVLQNAFIKAWKGLGHFRAESGLYTWLYRISTNESITHLQKKKKAIVSFGNEADLTDQVRADPYFDPARIEWKLQLAIQQLPEQQRLIFNLRYFDEMPYNKMSEILGVTEGALKASYHHAAKKVENYLLKS
ncbi:RNA polymerase sigma factor [Niabella hirudinis]|uniref:RNA polymerase sigma factor n=1 Tax=Niabella hirudinis TaxID=1285929 RepID=UPI003EBB5133